MVVTRAWAARFDNPRVGGNDDALRQSQQALRKLMDKPRRKRSLRCAACRQRVTEDRSAIVMAGGHEHTRTNPLGLTFHIGCYRDAPGCREIGEASGEHTWFAGYNWRIALCAACHAHLGWGFRSGDGDHFFGLILPRLIRNS